MQALREVLTPGGEEDRLVSAIDADRLPVHIAIIMDGNGRWAHRRRLPRAAGHQAGMTTVRSAIETCSLLGLRALTLYAFSTENWKRPTTEIEMLWRLLRMYLRSELELMMRENIRLTAIGRLDALPDGARRQLAEVMELTRANTGLRVTLAINYSGRADIVEAVKALMAETQATQTVIDEAAIARHLSTADLPDPDLLIRTSGEMRVSNFLLWQIAYSELYVTDTLWPDFNRTELLRAIVNYQSRDRRFGGLGTPALGDIAAGLGATEFSHVAELGVTEK